MSGNAGKCIVDSCGACWEGEFLPGHKNKNNCSGFVKAVASKLGISLPATANADELVEFIKNNWTEIESGTEAERKAASGTLVIAGLKSADHNPARTNGHVAIVIGGKLYRNTYPLCWGGSTGGAQSQGTKSIGEVWNQKDRDSVAYYAFGVASCKI